MTQESKDDIIKSSLAYGHQEQMGSPLLPSPQAHLLVQAELSNKPIGPGANFHRNVRALQSNNLGSKVLTQGLGALEVLQDQKGQLQKGQQRSQDGQIRPTEPKEEGPLPLLHVCG